MHLTLVQENENPGVNDWPIMDYYIIAPYCCKGKTNMLLLEHVKGHVMYTYSVGF